MNCLNCGGQLPAAVKFCPRCGTPTGQPVAQTPQPPPYVPPQQQEIRTSWGVGPEQAPPPQPPGYAAQPRRKSRAGKILLIILGVLVMLGVGAGVAIYLGYRYVESTMKSSEPYQMAEGELRRSEAARARLGDIKSTGFPVGTFKTEAGGGGFAGFTVSVEGTKASGRYFVTMQREGGEWQILRAYVQMPGGEMVSVAGGDEPGAEAEEGTPAGPAPPPPPAPAAPGGGKVISAGVLNGKAVSKPQPTYPPIAKAARAQGTVTVQVTVDESGKVISASAVSGHPLLQQAAVQAARQARFSPTLLSGKPVKVSGVLTYNFVLE